MLELPPPSLTVILDRYRRRLEEHERELQRLEYFSKGTVLKRMMKCGKTQCACRTNPTMRIPAKPITIPG